MDILMGQFCDAYLAALSDDELADLEILLEAPDQTVLSWLTGAEPTPPAYDTPVFRKLLEFHTHASPLDV